MKLYAPKYYRNFKCIADKCTHSCCIGWEIDIDESTLCKYRASKHPYASEVLNSIEQGEGAHFRLCEGDRCPHLDEKGLCRIILNLGEGYLCDICREHPRFYNSVVGGSEVGLGLACEEACRLVLSSDEYTDITEIGELCGENDCEYPISEKREAIYKILSDREKTYAERLLHIQKSYAVSPTFKSDEEWRELLDGLEYLDPAHKRLFSVYSSELSENEMHACELERALTYFIYRHCGKAQSDAELREYLGFCLFCERLLASAVRDGGVDIHTAARIISEEIEYSENNTEDIVFEFYFTES